MAYVNVNDLEVLDGLAGGLVAAAPDVRGRVATLPAGTRVRSRVFGGGYLIAPVSASQMPDGRWALLGLAEVSIRLGRGNVLDVSG